MSARSGLVGKKSSWPHLGPSEAIFSMDRKNQKNTYFLHIFLGGPMGPIHPVWGHVLVSFIHMKDTLWDFGDLGKSVGIWSRHCGGGSAVTRWHARLAPNAQNLVVSSQTSFLLNFGFLWPLLGSRGALQMIVSHRAPSSLNMSTYRAIWIHFRPKSKLFINLIIQLLASGTGSR